MVPRRLSTARLSVPAAALSICIGLTFASAGCVKTPLVAPSGTVITLIPTTNVLPVNGSTDIIALLIEQGTATTTTTPPGGAAPAATASTGTAVHNGTVVTFTTTLGKVEPAEAKTNGGQVTVKLIADGRSGVATITAYSGGASKTLTLNIGSAAATRIAVTANPQSLPASGGTSTITANVGDQQGNPVSGVTVTFSTSAGTIGQTSAVTDLNGNASTTVTTSATSAAPTVTASAGAGTTGTGLSGTVALTVQPSGTISLSVGTPVTVGVAATFTVTPGTTVPVSDVILNFGDGDTIPLGQISAATTVQHTYSGVTTYTPSATAKFVDGTSKTVSTLVVIQDYSVSPACPATEVTFGGASTMSVTVSPAGLSHTVRWDFIRGEDAPPQFGSPTTHVWQSRGTKTIQWTVQPTSAPSKSGVCQVEVK